MQLKSCSTVTVLKLDSQGLADVSQRHVEMVRNVCGSPVTKLLQIANK